MLSLRLPSSAVCCGFLPNENRGRRKGNEHNDVGDSGKALNSLLYGINRANMEEEAIVFSDPMSKIVSQLQSSLWHLESDSILSVLLEVGPEEVDLLNHACFGRPIITSVKDKQWFQLDFESFYMVYELECIKILGEDKHPMNTEGIWDYMR